jgi:hypothetical protein
MVSADTGKGEILLRNYLLPLLLLIMLLSLDAPGVAHARSSVLFDQGHGQKFLVERGGELDLSLLAGIFRDQGSDVTTASELLSDTLLKSVDILVISGPFKQYTGDEIEAVVRYLQRGGTLCITLHIAPPASSLIFRLGIDYSNGVIHEEEGTVDGDPLAFHVTRMEEHPLFSGVDAFNLYGVWALLDLRSGVRTIARTSSDAWVDLNQNGVLDGADARGSFGVVVAGEEGKGRFVVMGDDALFQNRYLKGGNLVLARNLAAWLAASAVTSPKKDDVKTSPEKGQSPRSRRGSNDFE